MDIKNHYEHATLLYMYNIFNNTLLVDIIIILLYIIILYYIYCIIKKPVIKLCNSLCTCYFDNRTCVFYKFFIYNCARIYLQLPKDFSKPFAFLLSYLSQRRSLSDMIRLMFIVAKTRINKSCI